MEGESEPVPEPPKTHVSVASLHLKLEHNLPASHQQQHEQEQLVPNGHQKQQLQPQAVNNNQQSDQTQKTFSNCAQQCSNNGQQQDHQQHVQQQLPTANGPPLQQAAQNNQLPVPDVKSFMNEQVFQHESKDVNGVTFSTEAPTSRLVPPRQRASMLPKPEVGPKPSYIRTSTGKRQLPLSSGPSSLNIMSTSLPSPFASSPSPSDSCDSSRYV